jgi:uncharacterized membrane protein YhaH (DUF805 family)
MEQVCEAEPTADLKQECPEQKHYAGMRRLGYFLGMLGAGVLYEVCDMAAGDAPNVASVGYIIALVLSFILAAKRLRNIGMGGWAAILILVPLWNVYIGIKCLICQEGYEDAKKLDATGRRIVGLSIGIVLFVVVGMLINGLIERMVSPT